MGWAGTRETNIQISSLKLADAEHTTYDQDDDKQQEQVREQAVDAEHDEDDGIVAAEVRQVVVDSGLHIAEVSGLRESLEVEELRERLEVGEAVRY